MTEDAQVNPSSDSKPTGDTPNAPEVVAKVFVGNLAFRTRNTALRSYFETIGTVENARVVTQGKRSMGYGFVQFAKLEDAKTAVEQLHKSRLDDREINVELSTSKNTNSNNQRTAPNRPRRRFSAAKKSAFVKSDSDAEPKPSPKAGEGASPSKPAPRRNRRNSKTKPRTNAANSPTASGKERSSGAPKSRANNPRANNPRVETGSRQVSDTILYVTNIPFALDDEGLKQAFADFEPVSANVIRRKRYNLSKGYGFVTFPDTTQQEAALAKNKTSLGEPPREIIVRKAHLRPETPAGGDDDDEKPKSETQTPGAPAEN